MSTLAEIVLTWLLGVVTFTVLIAVIWACYIVVAFLWAMFMRIRIWANLKIYRLLDGWDSGGDRITESGMIEESDTVKCWWIPVEFDTDTEDL